MNLRRIICAILLPALLMLSGCVLKHRTAAPPAPVAPTAPVQQGKTLEDEKKAIAKEIADVEKAIKEEKNMIAKWKFHQINMGVQSMGKSGWGPVGLTPADDPSNVGRYGNPSIGIINANPIDDAEQAIQHLGMHEANLEVQQERLKTLKDREWKLKHGYGDTGGGGGGGGGGGC